MFHQNATNTLRLGRLVKEYSQSSGSIVKIVVVSAFSGIIALFFFVGAGSMAGDLAGVIVLSIVGLLFLLPVFVGVYMLIRNRGATLKLYENGFSYRRGAKDSLTTWDEINSYIQDTSCRIAKMDGEVIEFGLNLNGVDEVAVKVQEETSKLMLPQMRAAIRNGLRVPFKGLKLPVLNNVARAFSGFEVDADGISTIDEGDRIAWKDVTQFGIVEEQVGTQNRFYNRINVFFIEDGNKSFRTRLGLLENAHVLMTICEEMSPKHQSGSQ